MSKSAIIRLVLLLACLTLAASSTAWSALISYPDVSAADHITFPRDFGAHPDFRTEWWYVTGWLRTSRGENLGFQLTFFRSRPDIDESNPSAFNPTQLLFAHAAISDIRQGHLLTAQKAARSGFGLAQADQGDTRVNIDDWSMVREPQTGSFHAIVKAEEFTLQLDLSPEQPALLEGPDGVSRKGPLATDASHYFSLPHLGVQGRVTLGSQTESVTGSAWLDREWSSNYLDARAAGWDWIGVNFEDGSALMAFQIRKNDGQALWSGATLRDPSGRTQWFGPQDVVFTVVRTWRSPRSGTPFPVVQTIKVGASQWMTEPMMDDQELDARGSTGNLYWEGAVRVRAVTGPPSPSASQPGQGYLELTGYDRPLKL